MAKTYQRPLKIMSENDVGQLESTSHHQLDIVWKIPDFLSAEVGKRYKSPVSSFRNTSWYIEMCPSGTPQGSIMIYVCRGDPGPPMTVTCDLFLKMKDGRGIKLSNQKYAYRCDEDDRHGPFILGGSMLMDRRSEFLPFETLTVNSSLKFDEGQEFTVNKAFSKTEAYPSTEKLSQDFSELLLSGKDSDLTVKVKNVEFRLHRLIMGARTPVFSATLQHDGRENAMA